jgi:CubicO group peptidase (beta-lactamase class C family)
MRSRLWLLGIALLCLSSAAAQEPDPRKAGLDPAAIAPLREKLQEFVDRKEAAGIVALVGRRGSVALLESIGYQDLEAKSPIRSDTIFRIASMTKPITALGIMMLEEDGKLSIEDPVEKHLPEFKGLWLVEQRTSEKLTLVRPPRPVTVLDLLTHTSGMPGQPPAGWSDLYEKRNRSLAEVIAAASQRPLDFAPGSKWAYCNIGFDTLGRLIEVAGGRSYERFLQERLFGPLGMKDTFFYPTPEKRPRLAKSYRKDKDGLSPAGQWLGGLESGRYPLPAGGLWSTAQDQATFYQFMLSRGMHAGRRLVSEATLEKMTRSHTGDLKAGFTDGIAMGLGWQVVARPVGVTEMLSAGSYGHGGALGTQGWIDPRKEMYFILMVQREGFGNGDASDVRQTLQSLAVRAIKD